MPRRIHASADVSHPRSDSGHNSAPCSSRGHHVGHNRRRWYVCEKKKKYPRWFFSRNVLLLLFLKLARRRKDDAPDAVALSFTLSFWVVTLQKWLHIFFCAKRSRPPGFPLAFAFATTKFIPSNSVCRPPYVKYGIYGESVSNRHFNALTLRISNRKFVLLHKTSR